MTTIFILLGTTETDVKDQASHDGLKLLDDTLLPYDDLVTKYNSLVKPESELKPGNAGFFGVAVLNDPAPASQSPMLATVKGAPGSLPKGRKKN